MINQCDIICTLSEEVEEMELWVKIGRTNKKFQGSFRSVMESIVKEAKGKKTVELLSFHAGQKERRRLKRELRANGRDLLKTASSVARWFYLRDLRRINRRVKELKRRAKYISKGEVFYCQKTLERVKELENKLGEIKGKLEELKVD
ncbi:hypothetical protein BCF55_0650 [Hydrogenivirga caldilitoris]|uniref:Uncharacterized protein n=2 Tax=Hydrogenivirga caldilitoris TaxID=246264 RepID=A0A497XQH3_9AQUI|nr:hypothetical protein BCF55_0650 [Hydrogenivirga caldilitoris]